MTAFQWIIQLYKLRVSDWWTVILAFQRFHQSCDFGPFSKSESNKRAIFIFSVPAGSYSWARWRDNNVLMHVLCVIMWFSCTKQMASMGDKHCPQKIWSKSVIYAAKTKSKENLFHCSHVTHASHPGQSRVLCLHECESNFKWAILLPDYYSAVTVWTHQSTSKQYVSHHPYELRWSMLFLPSSAH